MGINCAPLVANLFYSVTRERKLVLYSSDKKQADVTDAFDSTSRYLDDLINPFAPSL